ncbi:MAG: hypothetical protein RID09_11805 [Coleofasciculus sp. G1-WW12-02]|uniref:hypothetical protein n=1 Tax=unclassified Coleofasciculus TaxID=2692782 RepID=UPI0032FE257B
MGKIFLNRYSHKASLKILDHRFNLASVVGWALPTNRKECAIQLKRQPLPPKKKNALREDMPLAVTVSAR